MWGSKKAHTPRTSRDSWRIEDGVAQSLFAAASSAGDLRLYIAKTVQETLDPHLKMKSRTCIITPGPGSLRRDINALRCPILFYATTNNRTRPKRRQKWIVKMGRKVAGRFSTRIVPSKIFRFFNPHIQIWHCCDAISTAPPRCCCSTSNPKRNGANRLHFHFHKCVRLCISFSCSFSLFLKASTRFESSCFERQPKVEDAISCFVMAYPKNWFHFPGSILCSTKKKTNIWELRSSAMHPERWSSIVHIALAFFIVSKSHRKCLAARNYA